MVRVALRLLLSVAAVVLLLGVAEIAIRVVLPQNLILIRPDVWLPDDRYGWITAPDVDVEISAGERRVHLRTDARSNRIDHRGPPPAAPSQVVLAVGDSFLQAVEVDYEDTLGAVIERGFIERGWAGGEGDALRVVNSGVAGWTPSHYRLKVEEELASGRRYDAILVVFYLGNDIVRRRVDRFEPRAPAMRRHFRMPRDLSSPEIVSALLYPINDTLEESSHLFALVRDRSLLLRMRLGLTPIRMPKLLDRRRLLAPEWKLTAELCAATARPAERAGVPVLFALVPSIHEVDREFVARYVDFLGLEASRYDLDQPSREMRRLLEARGLRVIDLTPALREANDAGGDALYDRVTVHLSPRGHRVVGEALVPALHALLGPAEGEGAQRRR
jgi:hypothetical protein